MLSGAMNKEAGYDNWWDNGASQVKLNDLFELRSKEVICYKLNLYKLIYSNFFQGLLFSR